MKIFTGLMLLCIMPGVLSAAVYRFNIKTKKLNTEKLGKTVMFFILIFHGILSAVKSVLGEGNLTLIESFGDIEGATYLHYSFPLLLSIFVLSLGLKKLGGKKNIDRWIELADSVQLFSLLIVYLLTGRVSNFMYLCFGVISIAASASALRVPVKIDYVRPGAGKVRIKRALPVIFCWVMSVILYFPNELYLTNTTEFPMHYSIFVCILAVESIITLIVYVGLSTYFFTNRQFDLFYTGLFAWTVCGYLQTMLLNGKLYSLDGSVQTWSVGKTVINITIWCATIVLICMLKRKFQEKCLKVYRMICIYICLIQAVTLGILFFSAEDLNANEHVLTTEGSLDLHEEKNVLVFVLDFFDTQIIEQILEEKGDFLVPLAGFTYYPNTTSRYAFTEASIPYLLTGVEAEETGQFITRTYREYAYENSTLLADIAEQGYDIGIYTSVNYVNEKVKDIVRNYSEEAKKQYDIANIVSLMNKSSKYKMAPFALKKLYWYDTSEIERLAVDVNTYDSLCDLKFYHDLYQNGLRVEKNEDVQGAYRFYHLYGAHPPYNMTEDWKASDHTGFHSIKEEMLSQAKGSMKIVYEYIRQLKELGLYDNTTIIITADHGQNYLLEQERVKEAEALGFKETSNPILFVKPAGNVPDQEEEGPVWSTAPLSHTDLAATVIKAIKGEAASYGRTIDDYQEKEDRERKFLYGRGDIPFREFLIRGDVRDINNWQLIYEDE